MFDKIQNFINNLTYPYSINKIIKMRKEFYQFCEKNDFKRIKDYLHLFKQQKFFYGDHPHVYSHEKNLEIVCYSAIKKDDLALFKFFLEYEGPYAPWCKYSPFDLDILHSASALGALKIIKFICERPEFKRKIEWFNETGHKIATDLFKVVLTNAAGDGHLNIIKYIIENYDLTDDDVREIGHTAMGIACNHRHHDILKYLIINGANPESGAMSEKAYKEQKESHRILKEKKKLAETVYIEKLESKRKTLL